MIAIVWIVCVDHDGTAYGAPFDLQHDSGTFKILDIEFFDDVEVALLLRFTGKTGHRKLAS